MRRVFLLLMAAVLLGACALPVPLKIASWAIDGISLIATKKSITDHGLSLVAQKDCALWRGITGEEICSELMDGDGETAVASADGIAERHGMGIEPSTTLGMVGSAEIAELDIAELVTFETAAGPVEADQADTLASHDLPAFAESPLPAMSKREALAPDAMEFVDAWAYIQRQARLGIDLLKESGGPEPSVVTESVSTVASWHHANEFMEAWAFVHRQTVAQTEPAVEPARPDRTNPPSIEYAETDDFEGAETHQPNTTVARSTASSPIEEIAHTVGGSESDLYYVIGSFTRRDNAEYHAGKHAELGPMVFSSMLDGYEVNRVVVGPFTPGDQQSVRLRVVGAGIYGAWATRIDPDEWSLVRPTATGDKVRDPPENLAQLNSDIDTDYLSVY